MYQPSVNVLIILLRSMCQGGSRWRPHCGRDAKGPTLTIEVRRIERERYRPINVTALCPNRLCSFGQSKLFTAPPNGPVQLRSEEPPDAGHLISLTYMHASGPFTMRSPTSSTLQLEGLFTSPEKASITSRCIRSSRTSQAPPCLRKELSLSNPAP